MLFIRFSYRRESGKVDRKEEVFFVSKNVNRGVLYVLSLIILAFGIICNTKSDFGVTPIISVPYAISVIKGFNFGNTSMVMYVILAVVEYLLKWEKFKLYDVLQIPLSFVFTRMFNIFGQYLPDASGLGGRIFFLIIGITCTGIGAGMSLNCRLVPNPGDGIVQAISDRVHKSVGFVKNVIDFTCVAITCAIGFAATGHLVGVGVGTVCAMIGVGRVIAVYNHFFREKSLTLMGLEM